MLFLASRSGISARNPISKRLFVRRSRARRSWRKWNNSIASRWIENGNSILLGKSKIEFPFSIQREAIELFHLRHDLRARDLRTKRRFEIGFLAEIPDRLAKNSIRKALFRYARHRAI